MSNKHPKSPNAGDPHTDARERTSKREPLEEAAVFDLEDRDSDEHPSPEAQSLKHAIEGEKDLANER